MFRMKHRSNGTDEHEEAKGQEEKMIKELRNEMGELQGRALKYCTDECLRRYLRARNWQVERSKKMLEDTLNWRSTFKPEEIRWGEVEKEGESGKLYRANFVDLEGRTVLVMKPARQNTASHESQLRHLVYMLENAIMNLEEKQEQMVWLVDFTGWTLSKAVPIKTARETAHILQSHYPERLACAFLCHPPRIFEAFWKAIRYLLDPMTSEKVKFVHC